jgi:hypothetical protein
MDISNVDLKSHLELTVSRSEGATPHFWELNIMQRIFSSATRRETLGKHLKVIAAAVS